ncbi:hypothetical protein WMW71_05085 [Flavobacterium buctense]|uniref:Immunity protein 30 domain-containing protein n=1 Tax=Flavobacterium buctense TaxID=1648146 RepID=A0ABU9E1D1_9FLAO|nr:hypothetical protein [Flavobacterium buctense]
MIITEILEILKANDDGTLLNSLYDEFRDGRNRNDILTLLNSGDEMIGYGCDISCEIKIKDAEVQKTIMNRLEEILAYNKDSYNRERAFDALYGFYMDNNDTNGLTLLCEKLVHDEIPGIKDYALEFIAKNKG